MNLKPDQYTTKESPLSGSGPLYIAIFGRRNSGKSSLINLLTGQNTAIVSDVPGTTTDPVRKRVEVSGLGIVTLIDTAGTDDSGELGSKRVKRSTDLIKEIDFALLVISENRFNKTETDIIDLFNEWDVPFLIVYNKEDIVPISSATKEKVNNICAVKIVSISTKRNKDRDKLIDAVKKQLSVPHISENNLFSELVKPKDIVLLVTPIDRQAPKGRLILPQNQSVRNLLDMHCITVVIQDNELQDFLNTNISPALVVCDSTVFSKVSEILSQDIPLTSFSILFAYRNGDFKNFMAGTPKISKLKDGDNILILESCTHQTSCDDIGRVKLPRMIENFTGKKLSFEVVSGLSELPDEISRFALAVQCGGCMVSRRQLLNRLRIFTDSGIPITNYGMTIAYINGIFEKSTAPFLKLINESDEF